MSIWAHVSKKNPCPVCQAIDWCTFGDRAMLCQRIVSEHPHAKGGWYHFFDEMDGSKPAYIPKAKEAPKPIAAGALMNRLRIGTSDDSIAELATQLGVSAWALHALGAAWCANFMGKPVNAWAFPMRNGEGDTVGVRLRNTIGDKWAITGSRQGIFLPDMPDSCEDDFACLPEGPTSTAAFLTMGFMAIGRPNVRTGAEEIKQACRRLGIRKVVIVADNDKLKRLGMKFGHPGPEGAMMLKKELGMSSVIWQPTGELKDGRDFLKAGGTKRIILGQLKDRLWTKS